MLSFLFAEEGKPMVCFEMQLIKAAKFLLNFKVHLALCGRETYVFEREFMYL